MKSYQFGQILKHKAESGSDMAYGIKASYNNKRMGVFIVLMNKFCYFANVLHAQVYWGIDFRQLYYFIPDTNSWLLSRWVYV